MEQPRQGSHAISQDRSLNYFLKREESHTALFFSQDTHSGQLRRSYLIPSSWESSEAKYSAVSNIRECGKGKLFVCNRTGKEAMCLHPGLATHVL